MSRKVFDILASSAGVVVVVVLVIAGGLLTWGHSFVNSNVHSQLAQQQIYFRRPEQLGTYFREPSGFRLQITNEDSATFAEHADD